MEHLNDQSRRISEALDKLPPKCKEVFLLVKMQGLSYKQTAEALDISIKTVENQMGKAIRVLRESTPAQLILILGLLIIENVGKGIGVFWKAHVLN
jgi:RNA polymerase sigma-70 factor (ECF subfamily)